MGDTRGKGFQTPAVENPPHEQQEDFTVPEKDPGRTLSGKRLKDRLLASARRFANFPRRSEVSHGK